MVDKVQDTCEVPHTDGMVNNVQSHLSWFDYMTYRSWASTSRGLEHCCDKAKDRYKVSQIDGMVMLHVNNVL